MAQLDSASDSDSDGWRFESVWVRHFKTFVSAKVFFYACQTDSVPVADRKQRQIKRVAFEFVARSGHRQQNGKINKFCSVDTHNTQCTLLP